MSRNSYCSFKECIPAFIGVVEHTFTGAYLLKPYGAHYRKALRIVSKKIIKASDWTGLDVWVSPIVPIAPPPCVLSIKIYREHLVEANLVPTINTRKRYNEGQRINSHRL